MKLNTREVNVLANTVLEKVKEAKKKEDRTKETKIIKEFVAYNSKLLKEFQRLEKEMENSREKTEKELGVSLRWKSNNTVEQLLDLLPSNLPNIEVIKDKIVLEGLFEDKEDMKSFIEKLVKEFSK